MSPAELNVMIGSPAWMSMARLMGIPTSRAITVAISAIRAWAFGDPLEPLGPLLAIGGRPTPKAARAAPTCNVDIGAHARDPAHHVLGRGVDHLDAAQRPRLDRAPGRHPLAVDIQPVSSSAMPR